MRGGGKNPLIPIHRLVRAFAHGLERSRFEGMETQFRRNSRRW